VAGVFPANTKILAAGTASWKVALTPPTA